MRGMWDKFQTKVFIAFIVIVLIFSFYTMKDYKLTGNVIVENRTEGGCIFVEHEYGGNIFEIVAPQNNSYKNLNSLVFSFMSDYYGEDIIIDCAGDISFCQLGANIRVRLANSTSVFVDSVNASKLNEGNKTYTFQNNCTSQKCLDGNYTVEYSVAYNCESEVLAERMAFFGIDSVLPTIISVYPVNNSTINISSASSMNITPIFNATDNIGVANKTINTGSEIISLTSTPNRNITVIPGNYSWNFTLTDLAGNSVSQIVNFTVIGNSTQNTTLPVINNSVKFDSSTTTDNLITNSSIVYIKVISNSSTAPNLTLTIYDSRGMAVYRNSTSLNIIDISYNLISDGVYFYNATMVSANDTKVTPTRKITIDTTAPSLTIKSPTASASNFSGAVTLEFSATDENGVARQWINDGLRDYEYSGKFEKNLSEGNYVWTVYAKDKAGNIARETIRFSISEEIDSSTMKKFAIVFIVVSIALFIIIAVIYYLTKKPSVPSSESASPVSGPPIQPRPPIPPVARPISVQPMVPPTFKNNQPQ